jgi:hypothetical protein
MIKFCKLELEISYDSDITNEEEIEETFYILITTALSTNDVTDHLGSIGISGPNVVY